MSIVFPTGYYTDMDVYEAPLYRNLSRAKVQERLRGSWSLYSTDEEKQATRDFIARAVNEGAFHADSGTLYNEVITKLFTLVGEVNYNDQIRSSYTMDKHMEYLGRVLADAIDAAASLSGIGGTFDVGNINHFTALALDPNDTGDSPGERIGFLNTSAIGTAPTNYNVSYDFLLEILGGKDAFNLQKPHHQEKDKKVKNKIKKNLDAVADKTKSLSDYAKGATTEELKTLFKDLDQILLINNLSMMADIRAFIRHAGVLGQHAGLFGSPSGGKTKGCIPYGGRVLPLNMSKESGATMNPMLMHPLSYRFFRDIENVNSSVVSKFQFCKFVVHNNKVLEVPIPIIRAGNVKTDLSKNNNSTENCDARDYSKNIPTNLITVENLAINFKGTTPATAQNDVDVSVTFHVPMVASITKNFAARETIDGNIINYEWGLLDFLNYNTTGAEELGMPNFEFNATKPAQSRIILKVGYDEKQGGLDEGLKYLLKSSPLVLELVLTDHSIEKDQRLPHAKIKIRFSGYSLKVLNSPATDVLAGANIEKRVIREDMLRKAYTSGQCDYKQMQKIKKAITKANKAETRNQLSSILKGLQKRERLFEISADGKALNEMRVLGNTLIGLEKVQEAFKDDFRRLKNVGGGLSSSNVLGIQRSAKDALPAIYFNYIVRDSNFGTEDIDEIKEIKYKKYQSIDATILQSRKIYYTYLGDLVDVAMDSMYNLRSLEYLKKDYDVGNKKKSKINLFKFRPRGKGPETLRSHMDFFPTKVLMRSFQHEDETISIADIPVSMTFFSEWFQTEILDNDYLYYPLASFIRQLVQVCCSNFLNNVNSLNAVETNRKNTLFMVDSHLGLPGAQAESATNNKIYAGPLKGGRTFNKTAIAMNTSIFDALFIHSYAYQKFFYDINSDNRKMKGALNIYSTKALWNAQQDYISDNNIKELKEFNAYKPSCGSFGLVDDAIYNALLRPDPYDQTAQAASLVPIIKKEFSAKRDEYMNYLVCHAYQDHSQNKIKQLDDCYRNNIPVIRLPDFQYVAISEKEMPKNKNNDKQSKRANVPTVKNILKKAQANARDAADKEVSNASKAGYSRRNYLCDVVESISFTKKDDDYLREARYSSTNSGMFAQLTSVYSATVTLKCICTLIYPGQMVYIDAGIGSSVFDTDSLAFSLGLGGFHVITSVDHKFELEEKTNAVKKGYTVFEATYSFQGSFLKTPKMRKKAKKPSATPRICKDLYAQVQRQSKDALLEPSTAQAELINPNLQSVDLDEADERMEYYNRSDVKEAFYSTFVQTQFGRIPTTGEVRDGIKGMKAPAPAAAAEDDTKVLYTGLKYDGKKYKINVNCEEK